jgi:protein-S-isoprenylcysteine O-methyltransferase Ste14
MSTPGRERAREALYFTLGVLLIAGFVGLYYTRFTAERVVPPTMPWLRTHVGNFGRIAANAAVFIAFLVFLPYRRGIAWRSRGATAAFFLALFAEMFGVPLLVYILAPLIEVGVDQPDFLRGIRGWTAVVVGSWLTLVGMLVVLLGWIKIHRGEGLVTDGIYRYVRHPQYTGLALILTGWMLHWPTVLTLAMYPLLLFTYWRLARSEDAEMTARFGAEHARYVAETSRFIPWPRR